MRFAFALFPLLVACSSTSAGTTLVDGGGFVEATTTPAQCGNSALSGELPTCTAALEGLVCDLEAARCGASSEVCESGQWVVVAYNQAGGEVCDAGTKHASDGGDASTKGAPDASASDASYTCGTHVGDTGFMEESGSCPGTQTCCPGGAYETYYCYGGGGGCPAVP